MGSFGGVTIPHAYSSTDQIVGYWIDGRAIYERTVELSPEVTINANAWNNNVYSFGREVRVLNCEVYSYNATYGIFVYMGFIGAQTVTNDRTKLALYNSRDAAFTAKYVTIRFMEVS